MSARSVSPTTEMVSSESVDYRSTFLEGMPLLRISMEDILHILIFMTSDDSYFDQYPNFSFSSDLSVSAFLGLSHVHRPAILTELLRCFPRLRCKGFLLLLRLKE